MSTSSDQAGEFADRWEKRLGELKTRLREYLDGYDETDVDLSQYSARRLGSGDHVISTPGKVYLLKGDPQINPSPVTHERGSIRTKGDYDYNQADKKLEELIEEELGV